MIIKLWDASLQNDMYKIQKYISYPQFLITFHNLDNCRYIIHIIYYTQRSNKVYLHIYLILYYALLVIYTIVRFHIK